MAWERTITPVPQLPLLASESNILRSDTTLAKRIRRVSAKKSLVVLEDHLGMGVPLLFCRDNDYGISECYKVLAMSFYPGQAKKYAVELEAYLDKMYKLRHLCDDVDEMRGWLESYAENRVKVMPCIGYVTANGFLDVQFENAKLSNYVINDAELIDYMMTKLERVRMNTSDSALTLPSSTFDYNSASSDLSTVPSSVRSDLAQRGSEASEIFSHRKRPGNAVDANWPKPGIFDNLKNSLSRRFSRTEQENQ